ncbi:MAG: hypothetical protein H7301_03295 [Cryobacterium sp.]|nr:hypothetical protein [Oligoflexia bacterium]
MRIPGVLLSTFVLLSLSCAHENDLQKEDLGWEAIAKSVDQALKSSDSPATGKQLARTELERLAPEYLESIKREGIVSNRLKKLWGRSINFDEGAKAIIVPAPVLDLVLETAGLPPRGAGLSFPDSDRIAHAGFEHTYGYLLSNLVTPYGYKRQRWVRPDIERGFGLPDGTIAPLPKDGGLFANISVLAGSIAFRGTGTSDSQAFEILQLAEGASPAVRHYDYSALHGRRLTETLTLAGAVPRTVEIRTDFVPFPKASGEATGGNSELLIYSLLDSAEKYPTLISAFPIAPGFSDGATASKDLGENLPIKTRYNAYVSGVTDSSVKLTGKRSVSIF